MHCIPYVNFVLQVRMMEPKKSHESHTSQPRSRSRHQEESEHFRTFRTSFEQTKEVEKKIELSLAFMQTILRQSAGISMKDFWEAKKLCFPLFKQKINPIKRHHFWSEYLELADEARKLKEIMDEETAFSIEQIELAIESLEKTVEDYDTFVKNFSPHKLPPIPKPLITEEATYLAVQKELQFLKTMISRLDALRKETLATDMRISHKNRILKRLSKLGDFLFPKRKKLIAMVSNTFICGVENFVKNHFSKEAGRKTASPYTMFSKIKNIQSFAKCLMLNTASFIKTRTMLNECWDKIKEQEQKHKKEIDEHTKKQKKNFETFFKRVSQFIAFCEKNEKLQRDKIIDEAQLLQDEMQKLSLSREQSITLRKQIQKARSNALAKLSDKRVRESEVVQDLKNKLAQVIEGKANVSLKELQDTESELKATFNYLYLSNETFLLLERNFSDLRSFICDKKGETATSKEELEELFCERETLLEEIKNQMEVYRKKMGGSHLDFEKAMIYRELFDSAKIHLKKEMEALQGLEEKLHAD